MLLVDGTLVSPSKTPLDDIEWELRDVELRDFTSGKIIFKQEGVEVPKDWSDLAVRIAVHKYFYGNVGESGRENSIRNLIDRVATTIADWGLTQGYFLHQEERDDFYADLCYILVNQMAAFNTPVWLNLGAPGHKAQCSACFTKGHHVHTPDGTKDVSEVQVGDLVLTHKGRWRRVIASHQREAEVFELKHSKGQSFRVTEEHPFLTPDGWTKVGDLEVGSKLQLGTTKEIQSVTRIDIIRGYERIFNETEEWFQFERPRYLKKKASVTTDGRVLSPAWEGVIYNRSEIVPKGIDVTPEFLYFIGYWLGDGGLSWDSSPSGRHYSGLEFTFGLDVPQDWIDKIWGICEKLSQKVKWVPNPSVGANYIECKGREIGTWWESQFGHKEEKHLPQWVLQLPPKLLHHLIAGLIDSDGHIGGSNNYIQISNRTLMTQVFEICTSLGIECKLESLPIPPGGNLVPWKITFYSTHGLGEQSLLCKKGNRLKSLCKRGDSTYSEVQGIESLGTDLVFNIQVDEDESYVVDGVVTHNCFILDVQDNLESIEELTRTEMEVFRNGSGTGLNLSNLRGSSEKLSGGGVASGPVAFMKALDFQCGAMKSGGRARRAATMRILNADHPDIMEFIGLKMHSEKIAHTLIAAGYDSDWENGIYKDILWQNSNNSVRVTDDFMSRCESDMNWELIARTTKQPVAEIKARDLLKKIAEAAWTNGCPGLQFHDTANFWHTCKADGEIVASNPCSEYFFLNNTSCNLASINLMKLFSGGEFDFDKFEKIIKVIITAQDIFIDNAHYPNETIGIETRKYRTLGLGYANLGALLMSLGLPYNSDEGRSFARKITAHMQVTAYEQSAVLAKHMGPFDRYSPNYYHINKVMAEHGVVANNHDMDSISRRFFKLEHTPIRNAQVTVLAPTGTIGLLMDCDTTGVEPELALVKWKQVVGGGTEKIVNKSIPIALEKLGYGQPTIDLIVEHILATGTIVGSLLEPEDHPVFETALGDSNVIHFMGHLAMMEAVQPFLSGAISKTVNVPNQTTIDDIEQLYIRAWKMGLKSIAIYRDGSKGSQPVNVKKTETPMSGVMVRKKLPHTATGVRTKFSINGCDVYLHTGEYSDGSLGELFITVGKSGSTLQGLLNSLAICISVGLQHGVPVTTYVQMLRHQKFEPSGFCKLPGTDKNSAYSSIVDAIATWLEVTYCNPTSEVVTSVAESSGEVCTACHGVMVASGTCKKCMNCGNTSGCS